MALDLIKEQFPELFPMKIRLLGAGWDNTAFVVNDTLIFRFPRRECAVSLLESEWYVLPKIASHLPLPIPIPGWKGSPTPRFPWPFLGYRILPGITACYANLSEEERVGFAQPIARFLSLLHATSLVSIAECQSFEKNVSHLHWENLISKTLKNFEKMSLLGLLEKRKELESIIERLQDVRSPASSAVVVARATGSVAPGAVAVLVGDAVGVAPDPASPPTRERSEEMMRNAVPPWA